MIARLCNPSQSQSFFLCGPRGSGKSTLLNQLFLNKSCLWIDLLDQKLDFQLNQNPDSLLDLWAAKKPKWVVIDEVQKIPSLLDVVHRGIEKHKILFALTGSSSRKLKRGGANLLGGRAASFNLSAFSSFEIENTFNLHRALRFGLMPRFWNDLNLSETDIARSIYSYVQTYLKEEVAAEQLVRKLDPFRRFLMAAAQSNGRILNFANIERDSGIKHSQAERHFEILCDTWIGRYLDSYEKSFRKRQTQKSKFYFFDTGIVRGLTNLIDEPLSASTSEYGILFETFLMNEFFKLSDAFEKRWNFSYLRTKDDLEIDLIIEKPRGKPILIEMKSSNRVTAEHVQPFIKIASEIKYESALVLSNTTEPWEHRGVKGMHWSAGLREIFNS